MIPSHDHSHPQGAAASSASPGESIVDTGESPDTTVSVPGDRAAASNHDAATAARERDEYRDLLLRKTAEFDNYRRRVEKERRELADHVAGELITELLPVVDDFARALGIDHTGPPDSFRQGVELIHRRLLDVLAKRGVAVLNPLGDTFDPHVHEAVSRVPAGDHADGEIVAVYSPGYTLGDRLLRPARVQVATA
jgi:molecular chaperone GrpE